MSIRVRGKHPKGASRTFDKGQNLAKRMIRDMCDSKNASWRILRERGASFVNLSSNVACSLKKCTEMRTCRVKVQQRSGAHYSSTCAEYVSYLLCVCIFEIKFPDCRSEYCTQIKFDSRIRCALIWKCTAEQSLPFLQINVELGFSVAVWQAGVRLESFHDIGGESFRVSRARFRYAETGQTPRAHEQLCQKCENF